MKRILYIWILFYKKAKFKRFSFFYYEKTNWVYGKIYKVYFRFKKDFFRKVTQEKWATKICNFRVFYIIIFAFTKQKSPGGEIGIHGGLKIPWPYGRKGSSPFLGTKVKIQKIALKKCYFLYNYIKRNISIKYNLE